MKTSLYYFSATGNSLKIAKDLARELDTQEIVPIVKAGKETSLEIQADTIGMIFPVYCGTVPAIVSEFINRTTFDSKAYIFGVANCNAIPRNVLFDLDHMLRYKGACLAAGFNIDMPGNFIPWISNTPPDVINSRFTGQEHKAVRIARIVKDREYVGIEGLYSRLDTFIGKFNAFFLAHIYRTGKKFRVNETCNQCGICARVCPRDNITVSNSSVCWGDACEQCMACLHWCPKEAIQNGRNTLKRLRYHHPAIKVQEIIGQK